MNLFLLAAGEGTRFRPHTEILPKPAIPFCGAPLIYYSFYLAKCLAPDRVVVNTYHLPDKIHDVGNKLRSFGVEVKFSDEKDRLLGSAGGMAKAKNDLCGRGGFIALNADEVIIPQKADIMKQFYMVAKESSRLSTLMVMRHPEAGRKFGAVWANKVGKVFGFGKVRPETNEDLTPYHFIGPMYFHDRIFDRIDTEPSNILHDTLKSAIAEGEDIEIFEIECDWFETGNLEDYLKATESVLGLFRDQNPFLLQMNRELSLLMDFETRGKTLVFKHQSAQISNEAQIEGWLVAGPLAMISRDCLLKEVVVSDGVAIKPGQTFTSALLLN